MKKILNMYDKPGKWEVVIPFEKEGEEIDWVGIVDGRKPGIYELRVIADHKVCRTKGNILVRGVAGEGSTVKIYGLIKIRKDAQDTNDFLELRVLTTDKTARAIAEPELEIEANNVKASHAASVGQINTEQIKYLMSRGLKEDQSKALIIEGWLGV